MATATTRDPTKKFTFSVRTRTLFWRRGLAVVLGAALGGVALDARRRAARVDAGSGEAVADFYMHLWKCFFACYALLPFVR